MRVLVFALLVCCFGFAQKKDYPKDYFISPLEIPLHLSGTFGELRNNHFHSGIDFKTQQREGQNVVATADGYVSRIKVSTWGYGKALYITHPNGYTTVYGHLQKYSPEIEAYVKKRQYYQKSFEVEFFPGASDLKVTQGQLVGLSGNTGGSGGPHLHFEIRDSKTENIINPLFFGFDKLITDTKKPILNNVIVYPLGESSVVNGSERPIKTSLSQQKDGTYLSQTILANGKIGFGINTYDLLDFNYNRNGVFKIETFLNGSPEFNVEFNEFAFAETRYLNAYIDYAQFITQKSRTQKLFITDKYPLSLIAHNNKTGVVEPKENITYNYRIEVSDYHQNKITINIPIKYSNQPAKVKKQPEKPLILRAGVENLYEKENVSVYVAPNVFYEDFGLDFDVKDDVLTFADKTIPAHRNYSITFEDTDIPTNLRYKTYIASIDGNTRRYNKTEVTKNSFRTWTRNTGQFTLLQDTISPAVKPINFSQGKWMSNDPVLKVQIEDNQSGINTYNAFLNDVWILMEYDYKTKMLVHDFADQKVVEGKNDLRIIVTDNVGNSTTFETHFFRSQKTNE